MNSQWRFRFLAVHVLKTLRNLISECSMTPPSLELRRILCWARIIVLLHLFYHLFKGLCWDLVALCSSRMMLIKWSIWSHVLTMLSKIRHRMRLDTNMRSWTRMDSVIIKDWHLILIRCLFHSANLSQKSWCIFVPNLIYSSFENRLTKLIFSMPSFLCWLIIFWAETIIH